MPSRVRPLTDHEPRGDAEFVLYWMIASRRTRYNHSLDRAIEHAARLSKPLIVLEALRVGYDWASDRIHRFILDGMADQRDAFASTPIRYYPYVESSEGEGSGLLETLAERAAVVVTDDFPCFFLPRMLAAAAKKLDARGVALEAVDGNGLYPMRATERVFGRAFDFRRHLQKELAPFLDDGPRADPLRRLTLSKASLPRDITNRWPEASSGLLEGDGGLEELPLDHGVAPSDERGGQKTGLRRVKNFVDEKLAHYKERNHPDEDVASGLSPYLHFGQVAAHEVFQRVAEAEAWSPASLSSGTSGSREGWWGMSAAAEGFLDELVTWRELGFNFCANRPADYDRFESLPDWARTTIQVHASDPRPYTYTLEELEHSATHDELWNAAQRQIVREGRMHNYLRMLWGKKIYEWSPDAEQALERMIELNNKYGLDGRNPNSYSGIFWVLGRYDRAWGPERPVFGKLRYMTSESAKRKLRLSGYLDRYGDQPRLC